MPLSIKLSRANIETLARCDFDLCSSCAEKEDIENVCPRGHQLHPVQPVSSLDSLYGWICDVCGYQSSHEEKLDIVEVLRCDKRYPGGADTELTSHPPNKSEIHDEQNLGNVDYERFLTIIETFNNIGEILKVGETVITEPRNVCQFLVKNLINHEILNKEENRKIVLPR